MEKVERFDSNAEFVNVEFANLNGPLPQGWRGFKPIPETHLALCDAT